MTNSSNNTFGYLGTWYAFDSPSLVILIRCINPRKIIKFFSFFFSLILWPLKLFSLDSCHAQPSAVSNAFGQHLPTTTPSDSPILLLLIKKLKARAGDWFYIFLTELIFFLFLRKRIISPSFEFIIYECFRVNYERRWLKEFA